MFGHVEMDASIMEGSSMQAGAVASVGGIRHPVQLARFLFDQPDLKGGDSTTGSKVTRKDLA